MKLFLIATAALFALVASSCADFAGNFSPNGHYHHFYDGDLVAVSDVVNDSVYFIDERGRADLPILKIGDGIIATVYGDTFPASITEDSIVCDFGDESGLPTMLVKTSSCNDKMHMKAWKKVHQNLPIYGSGQQFAEGVEIKFADFHLGPRTPDNKHGVDTAWCQVQDILIPFSELQDFIRSKQQSANEALTYRIFCDSTVPIANWNSFVTGLRPPSHQRVAIELVCYDNNGNLSTIPLSVMLGGTNVGPAIMKERDVFQILQNGNGQLLVEFALADSDDLKVRFKKWLTNPNNSFNLPQLEKVSKESVAKKVAETEELLASTDDVNKKELYKNILRKYQIEMTFAELGGAYEAFPRTSFVSIQQMPELTYADYFRIVANLYDVILAVRSEFTEERLGKAYQELNLNDAKEAKMKAMADYIYPLNLAFTGFTPPPPPPLPTDGGY